MILITGASGFVGNNFVYYLNSLGIKDLVLVDTLADERSWEVLKNAHFVDFLDYSKGIEYISSQLDKYKFDAIFHIGADANVLNHDATSMMLSNFEFTKVYFEAAKNSACPFVFASSSAIYGNLTTFSNEDLTGDPHNVYAFSKLCSDKFLIANQDSIPLMYSFRFFNVFGSGEAYKDKNASLAHRFFQFSSKDGDIKLFDAEISRDYVYVEDVCRVLFDSLKSELNSGVYNLGSGCTISHSKIAALAAEKSQEILNRKTTVTLIPMPESLKGRFQYFTKADSLDPFISERTKGVEEKMSNYMRDLFLGYSSEEN